MMKPTVNRKISSKEKMGPVGVDIGSFKTVIACFDKTGPEVVPTEMGDKSM